MSILFDDESPKQQDFFLGKISENYKKIKKMNLYEHIKTYLASIDSEFEVVKQKNEAIIIKFCDNNFEVKPIPCLNSDAGYNIGKIEISVFEHEKNLLGTFSMDVYMQASGNEVIKFYDSFNKPIFFNKMLLECIGKYCKEKYLINKVPGSMTESENNHLK
jgi:hypothetical protein